MTMTLDGIILDCWLVPARGVLHLFALRWAHDKGNQAFLMAFMGGMVVRLLIVAVAFVCHTCLSRIRTHRVISFQCSLHIWFF